MDSVGIMICTYKRELELKKTLNSILDLKYNIDNINLIIVDNDKEQSSKKIINEYRNKIKIQYDVESKKGIAFARNKCLEIARKTECKYVAFIDDDEVVSEDWINELIKILKLYDADIVRGPVIGISDKKIPKWYKKGIIEKVDIKKDGTQIDMCFTGNVLMKKEIIMNMKFDTKYSLTGGEDTKFFMQLNNLGNKIVYSSKAIVYENITSDRIKLTYILKRAFRDSANFISIEREVKNINRGIRFIKSITKLFIYSMMFPIYLIMGYRYSIAGIKKVFMALGEIYGIVFSKTVIGY